MQQLMKLAISSPDLKANFQVAGHTLGITKYT